MRATSLRALRPLAQPARYFSRSSRALAEGDIAKGGAQGDAFSKREKAAEDYYIREAEKEKLRALHAKLEAQEKSLNELKAGIKDMIGEDKK